MCCGLRWGLFSVDLLFLIECLFCLVYTSGFSFLLVAVLVRGLQFCCLRFVLISVIIVHFAD